MRLIDADKFKQQVAGMTIVNNYPAEKANAWCELIDAQQIAYDVDSVVEQLEEEKNLHKKMIKYEQKNGTVTEEFQARRAVEVLERAIEIVKGGGVDV